MAIFNSKLLVYQRVDPFGEPMNESGSCHHPSPTYSKGSIEAVRRPGQQISNEIEIHFLITM